MNSTQNRVYTHQQQEGLGEGNATGVTCTSIFNTNHYHTQFLSGYESDEAPKSGYNPDDGFDSEIALANSSD